MSPSYDVIRGIIYMMREVKTEYVNYACIYDITHRATIAHIRNTTTHTKFVCICTITHINLTYTLTNLHRQHMFGHSHTNTVRYQWHRYTQELGESRRDRGKGELRLVASLGPA